MAEVELKFDIAARDVARLRAVPALRGAPATTRHLFAFYFDTPDELLAKHGLALRLRREGERWVQALKGGGAVAGSLHAREEWEAASPEATLDLARLHATPLAALPGARTLHERLRVAFEVDMERTAWIVTPAPGVTLEVALDIGCVRHGERRDAVREVEIESKSGPPEAIFDFAAGVLDHVALVPSAVTKAQRGYRLARGEPLAPVHAVAVPLERAVDTGQAGAAALGAALAQVVANAEGVRAGMGPEFVHQLRVGLRRARTAVRMFRRELGEGRARELREGLRSIMAATGRLRDLDVLATRTLPVLARSPGARADMGPFPRRVAREREAARRALVDALGEAGFARTVLAIARAVRAFPRTHARALAPHAARRLAKARKAVLRMDGPLEAMDAAKRHRLRVRAKRLRYALDSVRSLYPAQPLEAYLERLSSLQDALGRANDARVARSLLHELEAPRGFAAGATASLERQEAEALRAASRALGRLRREPPPWAGAPAGARPTRA